MHPTESRILQLLAKNPEREFSTSDLVKRVFLEEYDEIQRYIHNEPDDPELKKVGKRKKARLHRKLLYHLNKLEEEKILVISKVEGKGEKFFNLNSKQLSEGNKKNKEVKTMIDSVSHLNDTSVLLAGIEEFEEKKIIKRFDEKEWTNKINSFIIRSNYCNSVKDMYYLLLDIYPVFNDVVGLYGFEHLIDRESILELNNFIKKIDLDTKDYNKHINLIIDISKVQDSVKLTDFIATFCETNPERIFIMFRANTKSFNNHIRFMRQMIKYFSENRIKINMQNLDINKAPYLVGRAGAYTMPIGDWVEFEDYFLEKTVGVCFSETSLYVDIYRYFKQGLPLSGLRDFLIRASKALLLATTAQRKKSDILFSNLNKLNGKYQSKFFLYSFNYIRLWNYDVDMHNEGSQKSDEITIEEFITILSSIVEEIDEFCKSEETVFKSCGIPIRFRIALSSAFRRFDKGFLSERAYKKININHISDFNSDEIIKFMRKRESLLRVFKGGDRIRFFRSPSFTPDEIVDEFVYVMNSFNIPFFTYDFRERKGEVTLDNFM
ncbi:hypothetical protein K9M18_04040 [Candidatus Woesearchaeota archaeon]|nr:hypothetical protein [Candidatus Woesearchaeota archaeon]MCF8013579.1 hypothetical protein [Candidatus Woesearchaeota archaeon]